jgi:hypothetical protein
MNICAAVDIDLCQGIFRKIVEMRGKSGRERLYCQTFGTSSVSLALQQKREMTPLCGTGCDVSKPTQKNRGRETRPSPDGDSLIESSD